LELKNYMNARWAWMDNNLPGNPQCLPIGISEETGMVIEAPFPNPFTHEIMFRTTTNEEVSVALHDPLGRFVHSIGPLSGIGKLHRIALSGDLAPGTYVMTAISKSGAFSAFRIQH